VRFELNARAFSKEGKKLAEERKKGVFISYINKVIGKRI
jgi:hypothetical protein